MPGPTVQTYALSGVDAIGAAIAAVLQPGDAIGLSGDLGVGKTTLARAILFALDLASEAPSPSFAIVQPYAPPEVRIPVLHVDLYRIDNSNDVAEFGLGEARRDHAVLIEWPERLGAYSWADMLMLDIAFGDDAAHDDFRRLTARVPPAWEGRWPFPQ